MKIVVTEVTDENRESLKELSVSAYLGDKCGVCGEGFAREQLDFAVFCPSEIGRIAHKECWDKVKEEWKPN